MAGERREESFRRAALLELIAPPRKVETFLPRVDYYECTAVVRSAPAPRRLADGGLTGVNWGQSSRVSSPESTSFVPRRPEGRGVAFLLADLSRRLQEFDEIVYANVPSLPRGNFSGTPRCSRIDNRLMTVRGKNFKTPVTISSVAILINDVRSWKMYTQSTCRISRKKRICP